MCPATSRLDCRPRLHCYCSARHFRTPRHSDSSMYCPRLVHRALHYAYILFLFTKSDMKTIFFPIVSGDIPMDRVQ